MALESLLPQSLLQHTQLAFHAIRCDNQQVVAHFHADKALNPASNMKLLTTAAALELLGSQYSFSTSLYYRPKDRRNNTLRGNLYIQAGADPGLVTGDVFEIAQSLYAQGIHKIQGRLIFDIGRLNGEGLPPGFDQKDELASYRTAIGAASLNYNTYVVWTRPGTRRGKAAQISIVPPITGLRIENKSKTTRGSSNRTRVALVREKNGRTKVLVSGYIGQKARPRSQRLPRYEPLDYAHEVFYQAFRAAGISIKKQAAKSGALPSDAKKLLSRASAPLGSLIRPINKYSNNFMAEQLLWTLAPAGHPPEAGLLEIHRFLQSINLPMDGLTLGNGSGLYDSNRMSPAQLTHLLVYMHNDFRHSADFLASLAVMGVDGTTRRRLHQTTAKGWVRAKTGTLNNVSALSGYISAPGKATLAFSILANDFRSSQLARIRRLQDNIVLALSSHLRGELSAPVDDSPLDESSTKAQHVDELDELDELDPDKKDPKPGEKPGPANGKSEQG